MGQYHDRRSFLIIGALLCFAVACGGEEGTRRTIDVSVMLAPTSPMERDILVELFERDPGNTTAEARKIAAQQVVGVTTRGDVTFEERFRDDMEYYFTARPDPMLRCGADYKQGEPPFFRGLNAPTSVDLTLNGEGFIESCQ